MANEEAEWVSVTDFTTLAHGDRVRSRQTQFPAEHVVEGEFDKLTTNGRVMLVGRAGQYFADPSVRTWEKLTTTPASQAPAEPSWVPIEHDQIREGMYVRCRTLPEQAWLWETTPYEGHVTRMYETSGHPFFTINGEGRRADIRTWERRVTPEVVAEAMAPTPEPEPAGTSGAGAERALPSWVRTAQRDLAVGDRVRVTQKGRPSEVNIGTVTSLDRYVVVQEDDTLRRRTFSQDYRWFDKWVVPVESVPVPASSFAPPQVGEVFTRTYDEAGKDSRPNCTVRSVGERHDGNAGWRVGYTARDVTAGTVHVNPDGTLTNTGGFHPGAFIRPVAAVPETPAHPGGWEVVTDLSTLRVGDTVRATPDGIGGVLQALVTELYPSGFYARTTHVIEETSNGRDDDLDLSYVYGAERAHNTIKWLGSGPAPDPAAREARLAAQTATPLPEWATSLDAAKRHIHARSAALYRSNDNCLSGSNDFMSALGLPDVDEPYPTPPVVDETEQIKAFLTQVREAALETAQDHGKNMRQVETWLRWEGIVEPTPPPVRHTIEIEVPHDVTAEMVRRQVRVIDGWRMI